MRELSSAVRVGREAVPQRSFRARRSFMPRGDKDKYTDKQKRQAEHIEESYEKRGVSNDEAESRAWATVNKQDGGGKKSGSGRKRSSRD
jgi:plasmid stabilization system protein ParE